jgi:PTH1 family peptidyl-tRNA hydrolase
MSPIRLIVGLGNPGSEYQATRHNAGYWFVERIAQRHQLSFKSEPRHHGLTCQLSLPGLECRLLKPTTYMNRSGLSVASLANYFRIPTEAILVAHDELDLPPGQVRLKRDGGHAGHNGLRDIMNALGSREFHRLRIGIDRPNQQGAAVNYVLGRPSQAERSAIDEAIERATDCLHEIVAGKLQLAMNRLHSKADSD